jgi:endonuclease YncB( thermonuclease family)
VRVLYSSIPSIKSLIQVCTPLTLTLRTHTRTRSFHLLGTHSVGDADNFRLYHTPGFGWRGLVKFRHVPLITKRGACATTFTCPSSTNYNAKPVATNQNKTSKTMQNDTIHIRLAGMDAPEVSKHPYHTIRSPSGLFFLSNPICVKTRLLCVYGRALSIDRWTDFTIALKQGAHFGRTAQPHYPEALAWLKENIEGRRIKCELLKRDQYGRVVALPLLPRSFRPWRHGSGGAGGASATTRNLPLEMVRAGWGTVYAQKGAVYGSGWDMESYIAAEAEAQSVPFSLFLDFPLITLLFLKN